MEDLEKPKKRGVIKQALKRAASVTTIHGIASLTEAKSNLLRAFWACAILISISLCAYLIYTITAK